MVKESTIFYNNSKWEGIFHYLSVETKQENIYKSGVIKFSPDKPSAHGDFSLALGINNTNRVTYYAVNSDKPNTSFQIDFRSNRVVLFGYVYKATGWDFFDEFGMLGSNNGNDWTLLDWRERTHDDNVLYDDYFQCSKREYSAYRYIKFQTTGERNNTGYGISIFGLEFFGSIRQAAIITSCKKMIINYSMFCIFILLKH